MMVKYLLCIVLMIASLTSCAFNPSEANSPSNKKKLVACFTLGRALYAQEESKIFELADALGVSKDEFSNKILSSGMASCYDKISEAKSLELYEYREDPEEVDPSSDDHQALMNVNLSAY